MQTPTLHLEQDRDWNYCSYTDPLQCKKLLLAYEFVLLFSVPYTSKLEEADASEVPVVGSTKQLICNADKHGFPGDVKAMRWYKDGERINAKKQKYQISGY